MIEPKSVLRAVIFDFDGLIVDTESAGFESWRRLFADFGEMLTIERYAQVIGSSADHAGYDPQSDLEQRIGRRLRPAELEERHDYERQLRPGLEIRPGVRERLAEARELGLPCAVASSSPLSWVQGWLEQFELLNEFHHLTTLDDTGRPKPDPALFLLAAERMRSHPDQVLVLEDSLNGLRAAQAASMRCWVVPGPTTRHLNFDGAEKRLDSLLDVSFQQGSDLR